MSEKQQWEQYFRKRDQERADEKYMTDLVGWAEVTSRKLALQRVKERKNGLSPMRLHNVDQLSRV